MEAELSAGVHPEAGVSFCDVCAVHCTSDGGIILLAHADVHKHLLTYTGLAIT